jgi:hypothetical protein
MQAFGEAELSAPLFRESRPLLVNQYLSQSSPMKQETGFRAPSADFLALEMRRLCQLAMSLAHGP